MNKIHLSVLYSYLNLGLLRGFPSSGLLLEILQDLCIYNRLRMLWSPWILSHNFFRLLLTQFSPPSCYFFPLVLRNPQSKFFLRAFNIDFQIRTFYIFFDCTLTSEIAFSNYFLPSCIWIRLGHICSTRQTFPTLWDFVSRKYTCHWHCGLFSANISVSFANSHSTNDMLL